MLPLAKIEKGHDGCLFVLRRIAFQYFGDEFVVDFVELKWYRWIVAGGISVLMSRSEEYESSTNQQVDLRPGELRLPREMCMIYSGIEAYLTVGELAQYI